ncbi:MAG TPA: class I SAM-dependent methyltransferase [Acidimicrobiales bacterium]
MDEIHEAAKAFDQGAADYEKGRPSYPADVVAELAARLDLTPGSRVLDLAAGTGKFTRLLEPLGVELVAVEPVAGMRERLVAALPDIEVHDGTAEHIPLPDSSVDAVVVAQAFHWFDPEVALAEIARVLRPGGGLGLVWNERDVRESWVADLSHLIRWDERGVYHVPYTLEVDWGARIDGIDSVFGPVTRYDSSFEQELDEDTLVARVLSTSYLAAKSDQEKADLATRVRSLVAGFDPVFVLPYVTSLFWCRKA